MKKHDKTGMCYSSQTLYLPASCNHILNKYRVMLQFDTDFETNIYKSFVRGPKGTPEDGDDLQRAILSLFDIYMRY